MLLLFVGCVTSQQNASVSQGRICSDNLRAAILRWKLQTQLSVSPNHSMLAPGQPVEVYPLTTRPTRWFFNTRNLCHLALQYLDCYCCCCCCCRYCYYYHCDHSLHLFLSLVDRWGTKDDRATTFLHPSLFSAFRSALPNFKPVHSVTLSSHFFLCLPFLLPPCTVPRRIIFASPVDLVMCPYHLSLRGRGGGGVHSGEKIFIGPNGLRDH